MCPSHFAAVDAATLFAGIWSLLNEAWGDLHGVGCNSFALIYSNKTAALHLERISDRQVPHPPPVLSVSQHLVALGKGQSSALDTVV